MLEIGSTVQADLRSGVPPWCATGARMVRNSVEADCRWPIVVVGAGITGGLIAEHLTAAGHTPMIIDREKPTFGSTAASTAMLQWEIDSPLAELTGLYGFERAADVYRRSLRAVEGLKDLVRAHGWPCLLRDRSSLYLAGGDTGSAELRIEHDLRTRAGLPGSFLDHATLLRAFGIDREAALVSPGSADADPMLLSAAALGLAAARGARYVADDVTSFSPNGASTFLQLASGPVIEAGHVILATGYVMPAFVKTGLHRIASSWAIATKPQPPTALWRDDVLIWEASDSYLYARTTDDGRIVVGGEDEDIDDPDERTARMPAKIETIRRRFAALWPGADLEPAYAWSGAFGETGDGLPLIGRVPGHPRIYAAYGYGGNGITFSFMASRMIGALIDGREEDWFDSFAIDRPDPGG